jgi:hypothetical protein
MRAAKAQRQQSRKGHILTWGLKLVFITICYEPVKESVWCLKALTDHFRGGSRVVSFDPYS